MATTQCNQIAPMLGAFEDGELRGIEQQEVARHLAECASCKTELAATGALGEQLRATAIQPDLTGFTEAVLERIAQIAPPLHVRIRRYIESAREQLGTAIALSAAGLAAAALTALLVTPYAARFFGQNPQMQLASAPVASTNDAPTVEFVQNEVNPTIVTPTVEPRTVLASLESHVPSVAVWSAPENTTSVIWVPNQR